MYSLLLLLFFSQKHSAFYQHLLDDDTLHDAVAWDAAPIDQSGLPLHDRNSIHSEDEEENMDATTSDVSL